MCYMLIRVKRILIIISYLRINVNKVNVKNISDARGLFTNFMKLYQNVLKL